MMDVAVHVVTCECVLRGNGVRCTTCAGDAARGPYHSLGTARLETGDALGLPAPPLGPYHLLPGRPITAGCRGDRQRFYLPWAQGIGAQLCWDGLSN